MSASERLKALNAAASSPPWHFSGNDPDSRYRDEELIIALRNALPQIVAVVEAAEKLLTDVPSRLAMEGSTPNELAADCDHALSALEEALS